MREIVLLLGSFDPPHIGHAYSAINALSTGVVNEVWIVPAWQNPWKTKSTPFAFRKTLVQYLVDDIGNDIRRTGRTIRIIIPLAVVAIQDDKGIGLHECILGDGGKVDGGVGVP